MIIRSVGEREECRSVGGRQGCRVRSYGRETMIRSGGERERERYEETRMMREGCSSEARLEC